MSMSPYLKLLWHFGGLTLAASGAGFLCGWPGVAIVMGLWAVIATMADMFVLALEKMR